MCVHQKYVFMCVCVRVRVCVRARARVHMRVRVCVCVCVCVCVEFDKKRGNEMCTSPFVYSVKRVGVLKVCIGE